MNSQQELLDAINTISQNRDKSYDTPATVLRVEGDTAWVHIDGGADETPVQKTINCAEGETVQVRISNGSAFLVGNASAPPTDDRMANVAHFVAEQAEIEAANAQNQAIIAKQEAEAAAEAARNSIVTYETWYMLSATEPTQPTEESHTGWSTVEPAWSSSSTDNLYFSIRTVTGGGTATWSAVGMVQSYADLQILKNAIISTVASEYVAQGDSNVTELSSTMYQNVNGVNIFNNTLAVGDSYAHIDGDSFDIKEVTTAGQIDDTNDPVVASFGADEMALYSHNSSSESKVILTPDSFKMGEPEPGWINIINGWEINKEKISSSGVVDTYRIFLDKTTPKIYIGRSNIGQSSFYTTLTNRSMEVVHPDANEKTSITPGVINVMDTDSSAPKMVSLFNGDVNLSGDVYAYKKVGNAWEIDYKKTPTILTSSTISASTTSYTFSNSAIKTSSVIDIYDSIFGFAPTNMSTSNGSCTITFPAQSSSHQIKLFIY